ncbi:sigma factor-like helix-turn-helix DNA-binding protein [Sporosarcina quadrami]|nr:sigma factor-like helix-turn-helix DNA-binding protein [Sporosarcina quadrami]
MAIQLPKRVIRDRTMVQLFKDGRTLESIGDEFGLSRERVRQILVERGICSGQGGQALRTRRKKESVRYCEVSDCGRKTKGESKYCHWHKEQIENYGSFKCLVKGCDTPSLKYGMCNNHGTNFFINRQRGNVEDLNDYLKVQLAKVLMGKVKPTFVELRKFMKDNPEQFEKDLFTENVHG